VKPKLKMFAWVSVITSFAATVHAKSDASFVAGTQSYRAGDFHTAVNAFRQSTQFRPSSGALQNLGNAEWQLGQTGPAILAWEQALWLDPFNKSAHGNLRFVRKTVQLEAPDLAWYEVVSTWLPANWWAWLAGVSFWVAIGASILPGIFRQRKAAWHQAIAALGITAFLLSLPAHLGVHTRSRIGFIVQKETPLRLTPTREAQVLTRLSAGEPARWKSAKGNFLLIRTNRSLGWVEREQFSRICSQ
jgi:tetratricopeptide (TPR) repeat protein